MTDYTVTNNPVAHAFGSSATVRTEFALIATAVNSKANSASPTFTGTVTVPTPLVATAAATKAYCDGLSMAAGNLPVGGTTGQYLQKSSATNYDASWVTLTIVGTGGTTITGSVTLTASSAGSTTVTPSAPGLYATLPDATTCSEAATLYLVCNAGDYDYGVKDGAGTQLGWIRARSGAAIGLSDNSSAAGVWAYQNLEKTGITATYVNSTLTNMDNTIRRIALDTNRTCLLFGGVDCYAIVYDASTQTWGTATLVRATIASSAFIGVLSATDQVLVCSCSSTTAMQTVTLTISATTVTVNTPVATTLAGNWAAYGQMIPVGASWVVSYARATTTGGLRAITVSGTTPTVGAESVVTTAVATAPAIFASGAVVRALSPTTSGSVLSAKPYTVATSTLTIGTAATATITANVFRAFLNGNGRIVCHYINTTHFVTIFSLSGTTETASSVSLGTAPTNINVQADYVQVTASKTVFLYSASGATWYANILTDSSGTASVGTEISSITNGNMQALSGLSASGNLARFSIGSVDQTGQVTLDCSGASPTVSNVQYVAYSSGTPVALPIASDLYGLRNVKQLTSGQSSVLLGTGIQLGSMRYLPGSVSRTPWAAFGFNNSLTGTATATSNESYVAGAFTASTTGFFIQRVESAA